MLIQILKGLASCIPGANRISSLQPRDAERTARYYYSCWLRHLVLAQKCGMKVPPETVAELGPGHSLGMGLCALLSGSSSYFGLDVVRYTNLDRNLPMLEELADLFRKREAIPSESEFPRLRPTLDSYDFPRNILPDDLLRTSLSETGIDTIRRILRGEQVDNTSGVSISYFTPWSDPSVVKESSVDLIFSQAALEHVDDLSHTYEALFRWLKPGGYMTHLIDFKSHHISATWYGHWTYSEFTWRLIRGRRTYLLNRAPLSRHLELLQRAGFCLVLEKPTTEQDTPQRRLLAKEFRAVTDKDLCTSDAFLISTKPLS